MQTINQVRWDTYAQKYDMLLSYNPFYQNLHEQVMTHVREWDIQAGDQLADIGAGTGNYSIALAKQFPQAQVHHYDRDHGMNARTNTKKEELSIENLQIHTVGVDDIHIAEGSLRGLISIHALYTFSDPISVMQNMYNWLEPGGQAVLVNAGRIVKLLDWQLALGFHFIRKYGIRKTLQIMQEGKEISRQNAYIRDMQRQGTYWTHTHEEFCKAVRDVGFEILDQRRTFRGISDLVSVRKPL